MNTLREYTALTFGVITLIFLLPLILFTLWLMDYEEKEEDWQSKRENYLATNEKPECKYCGTDYKDPKYCSVFGRTADSHKFIK